MVSRFPADETCFCTDGPGLSGPFGADFKSRPFAENVLVDRVDDAWIDRHSGLLQKLRPGAVVQKTWQTDGESSNGERPSQPRG